MNIATIKLKTSFIDIMNVWRPDIATILQDALSYGAYVAGGFARRVAIHLNPLTGFEINDKQVMCVDLDTYLTVGGDIDVFFDAGFDDFIQKSETNFNITTRFNVLRSRVVSTIPDNHIERLKEVWIKSISPRDYFPLAAPTITKVGNPPPLHLGAKRERQIKMQFCNVGSILGPKEKLKTFDIFNGAVAFLTNEMMIPDGWLPLERAEMLHVNMWKNPAKTLQRLATWSQKHGLKKLSPKTSSEIGEQLMIALDQARSMQHDTLNVNAASIIAGLHRLLPTMSNEQLLLLASLSSTSSDEYLQANINQPLKILIERAQNSQETL